MSTSITPSEPNIARKGRQPSRFISSLIWGLLTFVLLAAAFIVVCQFPVAEKILPLRSVDSYHSQFEIKWFKLEDYVRQNGGVDVILLGNSVVNTGMDPAVMTARYQELTGQKLRIFNFGIEGMTVAPLAKLTKILEDKYHPGSILLITDIRDYAALNGVATEKQFLNNDWIKYKLGTYSLMGQLIDNSAAMQEILPFRNWSGSDFLDNFVVALHRNTVTTAVGYEEENRYGRDIDVNPNPNDPNEKENFRIFNNYSIDPQRIQALLNIIAYQKEGTKVFITGFPVYPTYYGYFTKDTLNSFNQNITSVVTNAGATYLPVIPYNSIPWEGRADNHHLNFIGAPAYSKLLAEQLAAACNTQQNCLAKSTMEVTQP